jgi:hypothetical protein
VMVVGGRCSVSAAGDGGDGAPPSRRNNHKSAFNDAD